MRVTRAVTVIESVLGKMVERAGSLGVASLVEEYCHYIFPIALTALSERTQEYIAVSRHTYIGLKQMYR